MNQRLSLLAAILVAALLLTIPAACAAQEELTLRVAASKAEYTVGDTVAISITVTNATSQAIARTFPNSQVYDIVVKSSAGAEVWRWSEGQMFAEMITKRSFPPGDTTFHATWKSTEAGTFTITGILGSPGKALLQDSTRVTIVAATGSAPAVSVSPVAPTQAAPAVVPMPPSPVPDATVVAIHKTSPAATGGTHRPAQVTLSVQADIGVNTADLV